MTNNAVSTGYADINGAKLYYEVAGEGHPFVMVHAGTADSRMWTPQFTEFSQRYRVIRYDQRGFGKSICPDGPFSLVDDLRALLDFLGVQRAYLMGCSIGGSVVIDFTLAHPEQVDALIPVGSGLSGMPAPDSSDELEEKIEEADKAGNIDLVNELEIQRWVIGPRRAPDRVDPAVRQLALDMNKQALVMDNPNAQLQRTAQPAYSRLGEIGIPTLVIVGDEDVATITTTADYLTKHIAGAQKAVMHDTAHLPNLEQPAEFNRLALDFLQPLASSPA